MIARVNICSAEREVLLHLLIAEFNMGAIRPTDNAAVGSFRLYYIDDILLTPKPSNELRIYMKNFLISTLTRVYF